MTHAEAASALQGLLGSLGIKSAGLNAQGLGGVSLLAEDVSFDHDAESGTLTVSATVHRFQKTPLPRVLQALREEAKRSDLGGGRLDYEPVNGGLFLALCYTERPTTAALRTAMEALIPAARRVRTDLLPRVATRLNGL